ncbi:hypothetical protein OEZ86_001504 [Tetradesmus obliquus]|nr:hypothetical protein OEZ86_001504 [Tetradesmus obliquus]
MFQMVRANQTFINCSFEGNTAVNGGGAQLLANATAAFIDSSIRHNTAAAAPKGGGGNGGGIGVGDRAQVRIVGVLLHNNTAELGGGLYVEGNATVNISSTTLLSNSAKKQGGGAHLAGDASAHISNSNLLSNNAQEGAGAFATAAQLSILGSSSVSDFVSLLGSDQSVLPVRLNVSGPFGLPCDGQLVQALLNGTQVLGVNRSDSSGVVLMRLDIRQPPGVYILVFDLVPGAGVGMVPCSA